VADVEACAIIGRLEAAGRLRNGFLHALSHGSIEADEDWDLRDSPIAIVFLQGIAKLVREGALPGDIVGIAEFMCALLVGCRCAKLCIDEAEPHVNDEDVRRARAAAQKIYARLSPLP
jgi:hypothetical protein